MGFSIEEYINKYGKHLKGINSIRYFIKSMFEFVPLSIVFITLYYVLAYVYYDVYYVYNLNTELSTDVVKCLQFMCILFAVGEILYALKIILFILSYPITNHAFTFEIIDSTIKSNGDMHINKIKAGKEQYEFEININKDDVNKIKNNKYILLASNKFTKHTYAL